MDLMISCIYRIITFMKPTTRKKSAGQDPVQGETGKEYEAKVTDNSSFINLHVHTEFSLLDGAISIKKMINKAISLGMDSVAITGILSGLSSFLLRPPMQVSGRS
jgi:hypothetical protein